MDPKHPLSSKTVWINAVLLVVLEAWPHLVPPWALPLVPLANLILRGLFTARPLSFSAPIFKPRPAIPHKD